jgi:hypothetical protein
MLLSLPRTFFPDAGLVIRLEYGEFLTHPVSKNSGARGYCTAPEPLLFVGPKKLFHFLNYYFLSSCTCCAKKGALVHGGMNVTSGTRHLMVMFADLK